MPKFFQNEIAAFAGEKIKFQNVEFKKGNFENSNAAELGTLLEIIPVHIRNPPVIQFVAYIDQMTDSFRSDYSATQPFGRPDPYYVWKSLRRSISLGWAVPSSSVSMGLNNLNNLSWFLSALYPTYKDSVTATSIAASPIFRVRHANLISSPTNDGQGILCVIQGVRITHDTKSGYIHVKPRNIGSSFANEAARVIEKAGFQKNLHEGKGILVPKLMKIGCTLNIVHDHSLGWDYHSGRWRGGFGAPTFPYDFGLHRTAGPGSGNDTTGPIEATSAGGSQGAPGSPESTEVENKEAAIFDKGSTHGQQQGG